MGMQRKRKRGRWGFCILRSKEPDLFANAHRASFMNLVKSTDSDVVCGVLS